ncbi:HNH endonuclease signature motif containing protein [Arthrobacter parietis]|uniref:HNH endonuclease signature motif containing protein n=1 Tax=Arthrobacter parietis TaxID=271434 RepID=A0ABN3APD8_9MICC
MGIAMWETLEEADGLTREEAYERVLDAAYAEADQRWWDLPPGQSFALDWDDEFDDGESEARSRAAVDSASAYQLVGRLQNIRSSESRRSRTIADSLDLLRAAQRLASWAAARQAVLIADVFDHMRALDGTALGKPGEGGTSPDLSFTMAAEEIAPLLRVPGRAAQRMLGEALRLREDLPGTWEALDDGTITPTQAQVIVQESQCIPAEATAGFEDAVLETAGALTRPKLARRCRQLREKLHPESIIERKARGVKDRRVAVEPEQDGMAWLSAYLPAEQAQGIFNRVDAAARSLQGPEEARTLSQLRADVFADVLTHTCTGDPKKGTGFRGVGATVFVTVPVMTLLGHKRTNWQDLSGARGSDFDESAAVDLSADGVEAVVRGLESAAPDLEGCENGYLDGYGPIDPETARNLAAHAPSFTRILVHPETGAVLSVGRDRYRPPKHLQDWVRIKNPTCIHSGCNRSSWSCEIDHLIPWAHGGQTSLTNLGPRCKRHHMMKTEGLWSVAQDDSGTLNVTSLGGETYVEPPELPPPF